MLETLYVTRKIGSQTENTIRCYIFEFWLVISENSGVLTVSDQASQYNLNYSLYFNEQ